MSANKSLLILPGDGIGSECMAEVRRVVHWLAARRAVVFEIEEDLVGGAAIDAHGVPVTDATVDKALSADAVLLGAVGGPKWDDLPFEQKPERGLLRLRKDLALFANLRPAICFDALVAASTLKPEVVAGLDLMIVRELTGGIYFGEPRGIEDLGGGERRGINTQVYTTSEIRRVAAVAFELARKRRGKVTSAEKANVMESGVLWRQEVTALHAEAYQDVELSHIYADNCAMQLVRWPKQFDVIVTDNLFGDMLSDQAAMLTGSLGMLPSASLGAADESGRRPALYEPVHGSAPDIAGSGQANPIACLLSLSMMLRYSFDLGAEADLIEDAVKQVLAQGVRTADIAAEGITPVSTGAMGDAILRQLDATAGWGLSVTGQESDANPAFAHLLSPLRVMNAHDFVAKGAPGAQTAVVWDRAGGQVGAGVLDAALAQGLRLDVVTPAFAVGEDVDLIQRVPLYERLLAAGARFHANCEVSAVAGSEVVIRNVYSHEERRLGPADLLIAWTGRRAADELGAAVAAAGLELHLVGDCVAPRSADIAMAEGALAARKI